MKTMKKVLTLLLALCMLFALVACGGKADPGTPDDSNVGNNGPGKPSNPGKEDSTNAATRDTLTIAVTADFGSLDFMYQHGNSDFCGVGKLYAEALYDILDDDGTVRWQLATSSEMISPTEWIYHLREGVKFTNGNDFTADDFMFTLDKCCNTEGQYSSFPLLDWEKCAKIDDYTVKVVYKTYAFQYYTNMTTVRIVDAESYTPEEYAVAPIGTGAYKVTDYVVNSHVYMEANEDYWGEAPNIKKLRFLVMNEDTQRVNALETGDVDVANVPLADAEFVSTLEDYKFLVSPGRRAPSIFFNTVPENDFKNTDARMAVCYAIDRQAIVNIVYGGYADICTAPGSESASDLTDNLKNFQSYYEAERNLDLAKEYAEKAGIVGKTYRLATDGSNAAVNTATIIQDNLKDIGVTVEINNYDAATFNSLNNDPSTFDLYLRDMFCPTNTIAQAVASTIPVRPLMKDCTFLNLSEEETKKVLETLPSIMSEHDQAKREVQLAWLLELFEAAPAWFTLCEPQRIMAIHKDLEGAYYAPYLHSYYGDWYWTN